jgi:serine/threonine-protein kinase
MYNKEGDVIAGKDEYLSPEQARCEVTDHRADLFCCGIVMSELLLSRNIFEAYESEDTIHNILEMEIPDFIEIRADIDPRLNKILQTSLQRQREKRYQSSEEMLTELESFIYGEGYGPTNEKLAAYTYDLFGEDGENAALRWHRGETQFADH